MQQDLAYDADYMLQPGEAFPEEASSSLASIIASVTRIDVTTVQIATATVTAQGSTTKTKTQSSQKMTTAGITGIALAVVAIVVALAMAARFWRRRQTMIGITETKHASQGDKADSVETDQTTSFIQSENGQDASSSPCPADSASVILESSGRCSHPALRK